MIHPAKNFDLSVLHIPVLRPKSNLIKDKIPVLAHELTSYVNTMILIGNLDLGHIIDTLNYFATPTPKLLVLVSLDLDSGLTLVKSRHNK